MAPLVDLQVASRLRGKRRALGLSEDDLALELGIGTGQIRAYERAVERIPTHHLVRLSHFLDVPLTYFFPAASSP
jgi:transcriptional regulator with XRE-family HTH domain